jgi:hypothetical protein
MPLTILPLPARFGTRAEFQEGQSWLERFQDALHEFFDDWLPSTMAAKDVLERIKVPQVDYFAFGEKLAVIEQGTNDPEGMGFVYDKVATLLASNFADLESVVGADAIRKKNELAKERFRYLREGPKAHATGYRYDLFVSYGHDAVVAEWIQNFLKSLTSELQLFQPDLKIFFDVTELAPELLMRGPRDALAHSKLLLAFLTPTYFMRAFTTAEFLTFHGRAEKTKAELIVPIILRGRERMPPLVQQGTCFDLSDEVFFQEDKPSGKLHLSIRKIAQVILQLLDSTPPFNEHWPVVTPEEAEKHIPASEDPSPSRS